MAYLTHVHAPPGCTSKKQNPSCPKETTLATCKGFDIRVYTGAKPPYITVKLYTCTHVKN
jgi:hypothetical protein